MNDTDVRDRQNQQHHFALQRGSAESGRLVLTGDIASLTLLSNPGLSEFVRGRFSPHLPGIQVQEEKITIQYHDPCIEQAVSSYGSQGEIKLNPLLPCEIELHGSILNLNADLRELELRSLDLLGSLKGIRLFLSKPANTSFIYMSGEIHSGSIHVLPGVGIRVRVSKRITKLVFGDLQVSEIDREASLENSDFHRAASRYDIYIAGGAGNLTIEQ